MKCEARFVRESGETSTGFLADKAMCVCMAVWRADTARVADHSGRHAV